MKLILQLHMPSREHREHGPGHHEEERSIEDEVRELIELVQSHRESAVEWKALRRFWDQLCKCKQTPRVQNLRGMIKPVLSKYGYHVE